MPRPIRANSVDLLSVCGPTKSGNIPTRVKVVEGLSSCERFTLLFHEVRKGQTMDGKTNLELDFAWDVNIEKMHLPVSRYKIT